MFLVFFLGKRSRKWSPEGCLSPKNSRLRLGESKFFSSIFSCFLQYCISIDSSWISPRLDLTSSYKFSSHLSNQMSQQKFFHDAVARASPSLSDLRERESRTELDNETWVSPPTSLTGRKGEKNTHHAVARASPSLSDWERRRANLSQKFAHDAVARASPSLSDWEVRRANPATAKRRDLRE